MNLPKSVAVLVLLLIPLVSVCGQDEWKKIAPVGHTFSVMMPAQAIRISRSVRVSETESIPAALYCSVFGGKRFVATSFYKTNVETVMTLSSFEKFLEGMEHSLRINKDVKSLKFTHNVSVGGARGKQYELVLAKYPGIAEFLTSEKGFYVLVMIGDDQKDQAADRFFSSFDVADVNTDEATSGVTNRGNVVTMVGSNNSTAKSTATGESPAPAKGVVTLVKPTEETNSDGLPPQPWPDSTGSITGGVINGRAIKLVQPQYPAAARNNHESGQVKVQIVINEVGSVIAAQALNGSSILKVEAEGAAWQCKFTPTFLMGQPVKVSGIIVYNFVAQ
jgi:TonB family protein